MARGHSVGDVEWPTDRRSMTSPTQTLSKRRRLSDRAVRLARFLIGKDGGGRPFQDDHYRGRASQYLHSAHLIGNSSPIPTVTPQARERERPVISGPMPIATEPRQVEPQLAAQGERYSPVKQARHELLGRSEEALASHPVQIYELYDDEVWPETVPGNHGRTRENVERRREKSIDRGNMGLGPGRDALWPAPQQFDDATSGYSQTVGAHSIASKGELSRKRSEESIFVVGSSCAMCNQTEAEFEAIEKQVRGLRAKCDELRQEKSDRERELGDVKWLAEECAGDRRIWGPGHIDLDGDMSGKEAVALIRHTLVRLKYRVEWYERTHRDLRADYNKAHRVDV